jgi:hypothetical protein
MMHFLPRCHADRDSGHLLSAFEVSAFQVSAFPAARLDIRAGPPGHEHE